MLLDQERTFQGHGHSNSPPASGFPWVSGHPKVIPGGTLELLWILSFSSKGSLCSLQAAPGTQAGSTALVGFHSPPSIPHPKQHAEPQPKRTMDIPWSPPSKVN